MQPVTERDIKSKLMIQNKQKITPVCGGLLCKWSKISVSSVISLFSSLVTFNLCCALWFFICIIFYIQHGKAQLCRDPLSVYWVGTAFLCLLIICPLKCCETHSHLWIENALACKLLNRNMVFISVLLRFVSLGFYHIFTNMLRIHLLFLVWQQKHCCCLKSHSLSLDFHTYKHVGK